MRGCLRLEGRPLFHHPFAREVMRVLAERGYADASIEEFCARAKIPIEFVADNFESKADLVMRVFGAYVDDFQAAVQAAHDAEDNWPDDIRAAGYETVRWMVAHPAAAQFGIVGALGAPEMVRVRRDDVLRWAAGLIDAGRVVAPDPSQVPEGAALLAIGSVADSITSWVSRGSLNDPVAVVPELMYIAVRPYLGEEAARRELSIPPPPDLRSG